MVKYRDFDSLLSDPSSSEIIPQHGNILVMHLLKCSKNLSKVRDHVHHLYTNGISCLKSQSEEMASLNIGIDDAQFHIHILHTTGRANS